MGLEEPARELVRVARLRYNTYRSRCENKISRKN